MEVQKVQIIIAIAKEMNLPVKLVGVGEKMEDLKSFNPDDFINALFEGVVNVKNFRICKNRVRELNRTYWRRW